MFLPIFIANIKKHKQISSAKVKMKQQNWCTNLPAYRYDIRIQNIQFPFGSSLLEVWSKDA